MNDKRRTNNKNVENEISHISFEIDTKLRNKFKGKIGNEGKRLKDVMVQLMEEYLKEKK
jgi:hypothetical protein